MTSGAIIEGRDQMLRWIEEGQHALTTLRAILADCDRVHEAAATAEREGERLREEVSRLRAENDRFRHEREEIVEALARLLRQLGREPEKGQSDGQRPVTSQRRGKIKYLVRQTAPGVTELVEVW